MNDYTMMHVFFFVSTVFVGLLSLLVFIVLLYVWKILHTAKKVTDRAVATGEKISNAVSDAASSVKSTSKSTISNVVEILKVVLSRK